MKTFDELVDGIKELKKRGFIKTHRSGNTGIGKTLEDELGIEENNFPGPDGITTELKAARKNSKSMLTLFRNACCITVCMWICKLGRQPLWCRPQVSIGLSDKIGLIDPIFRGSGGVD